MELDDAIESRKSVRKYSSKKPDWRDVIECIDPVRFAPMAGNIYTLRFIMVTEKEKIDALAEASQQPFIADAEYVIVAYSDPTLIKNAYPEFTEKFCRQQAGAAIQNFLLKITENGLATCWIGYFIENQVKTILRIPEHMEVEALFPIAYESKSIGEKSKKKPKVEMDRILYFNFHGNKKLKGLPKMDV